MKMRVRRFLNLGLFAAIACVLLTFCFWSQCNQTSVNRQSTDLSQDTDVNYEARFRNRGTNSLKFQQKDQTPIKYHELDCVINGEYSIKCRRDGNEVFVPFFSFIQKYFEIYGKLSTEDGYERLEWEHSYSTVHRPREKYSPAGVFMSFEYYNVEERDRVRCISAMEGVPLSTQWTQNGHYYPIQISQFGLSHLSKYLTQPEAEVVTLEDGEDDLESWILPDKRSQIDLRKDPVLSTTLVEFTTSDSLKNPGISLPVDEKEDFVLSADIKFASDGSITVTIETPGLQLFYIHYVLSTRLIFLEGHDIYYGLGDRRGQWMHITRDIAIDFDKGLALKYNKSKRTKMKLKVSRINNVIVRGHGWLDNLTLSTTAHLDHFYNAANWLVLHQNDRGGWPISVQRKLIPDVLELEPGWYSAMAQGQAMSLLVRAYLRSHNTKYIQAAVDAMKLFEIPSMQGGVLAKYADRYDWYEEYPTTPSSFVLNGFIYSLFGLYDLKEVTSGEESNMAERLYNKGIESLKHMLLMFDNGSGTFYDLRHITLGIAPNRARWDYHTTHINQLLQLSVMDDSKIFKVTAQRWMDYMKGKRAKHN